MKKYQYNKAASMFDGLLRQRKTRAPLPLLLQLEHCFQGNWVCQGSKHHSSNVLTTWFQWPVNKKKHQISWESKVRHTNKTLKTLSNTAAIPVFSSLLASLFISLLGIGIDIIFSLWFQKKKQKQKKIKTYCVNQITYRTHKINWPCFESKYSHSNTHLIQFG